jgi:hypothetical protein
MCVCTVFDGRDFPLYFVFDCTVYDGSYCTLYFVRVCTEFDEELSDTVICVFMYCGCLELLCSVICVRLYVA